MHIFAGMEQKSLKKWISLAIPALLAALIIFLSGKPKLIEAYYSNGLYPLISKVLRSVFGIFPFSIGDILYALAIISLIRSFIKFIISLKKNNDKKSLLLNTLIKSVRLILWIYFFFNILWGLNYSRQGVKSAFELQHQPATPHELIALTQLLKDSVNANVVLKADSSLHKLNFQFIEKNAYHSYRILERKFPFLSIKSPSFKKSLFGKAGNYLGYQGYYNPFTAESQINMYIPSFMIPFVSCHEIAHQAGFASESEANFVGFLAATHSEHANFRYAAYLEMYLYASGQLRKTDSIIAKSFTEKLHPTAKNDIRKYIHFLREHQGILQEGTNLFYDFYLRQNKQKKGIESYGDVTNWLVAYFKKEENGH